LSNLDAKLRVEMRRELKQLHRRLGATMVYVTHDQVEALTLGERIAVMHDGKVQQVGAPMDVYRWPANRFVAGFIGTPAMNFIDGELVDQDGPAFRRGTWTVPLAGKRLSDGARSGQRATLGVRPEDVRLRPLQAGRENRDLEGTVELVEMLGDATVTTVRADETEHDGAGVYVSQPEAPLDVVIKSEPRDQAPPGTRLALAVVGEHVHVFDPQTGENWVRRPREA
jgi:multiple sugar transport system ATP-binding protein